MARFGLAACTCLLIVGPAFSCSVPVFRYALERWLPSRYELVVYHRGSLSAADKDAVGRLTLASGRTNVRVTEANLDGRIEPGLRTIWERESKGAPLPHLVVRYPESEPEHGSAWSGPLSVDHAVLFDSPARRELFDRLTSGNAGAILLLLSGDPAADAAARAFLSNQVQRISSGIELPAKADDGPQVQSALPLWVRFPVVAVPRTPAEEALVRILLGSEDGLAGVKGPIAFPVFGRGRVLCSLHGKDLSDPAELQRSLEFLSKACSCQVKELNPGVDLLMSGVWDVVFNAEPGPAPRLVSSSGLRPAESRLAGGGESAAAEFRAAPPPGYSAGEREPAPLPPSRRSSLVRFGTVAAGLLVVATGFWVFRGRRTPPPHGS